MLKYKTLGFTELLQIFPFNLSLGWGKSEWGCRNTFLCFMLHNSMHVRYCPVLRTAVYSVPMSAAGGAWPRPRPALYKYAQTLEHGECFLRPPAASTSSPSPPPPWSRPCFSSAPSPCWPSPPRPLSSGEHSEYDVTWTTDNQKQSRLSLMIKK